MEIHVPEEYSAKRPAVTFSHNDLRTTPIGKDDLGSQLPIPTEGLTIQPSSYSLIDLGMREDIPKTVKEMIDCDCPQISVHIVSFQDATLVGISWPHSAMGSLGFRHFIHSWSLVLDDRQKEVPEFLGANEDVLLEVETREPLATREETLLEKSRLAGLRLVMFLLRLVWSMRTPREVKSIFIPKRALAKLQAACQEEVAQTFSESTVPPSEETTLLAWFARLATSDSSNNKPITIVTMLNAMQAASSLSSQAGINVHNMTMYAVSFLSSGIARGELGPLAHDYASQIREQSTQEQVLSFLRMYRQTTQDGVPFKPYYGPSNAHPVACNDLGNADLIHSVNFSAAVLEKPEDGGERPPGALTCYYYNMINRQLGAGLDCIYLLGKDHGGNLWVTAALPASTWSKVEAALKDYQYGFSP